MWLLSFLVMLGLVAGQHIVKQMDKDMPPVAVNSRDVCQRDPPDTSASKTPGDNGFRIKVSSRLQTNTYTPGQVYTVSINGTYPNQKLLGFMVVAVPVNAYDETTTMGTFQHFNHGLTKFEERCPHVVTHTYDHPKAGIEVLWTAPPAGSGCIEFRATVVEYKDIWYKDDGALTKIFCEETGTTDANKGQEMIPDCCACGTAKYQMTFHGLWTRQTHPEQFPSHKRLLHWSNVVGASHSRNYMIWQYGAYASKGIKEVCEFGYPRTLEQEMRRHSKDVRTVIKTTGIWWKDPIGLKQTRWARFSVDSKNHLFSMLTMLGPSPDWCVGVTALDLCLPNCTWAGDLSIDLLPWDAGTDDGISYMSRNLRSDPQQKISRITNLFPNNPNSPFYSSRPIVPLARLTLHRIHPKPGAPTVCYDNETIDDEEDADFGQLDNTDDGVLTDMEKKKMMMAQAGKCGTGDWGDWSECSVTCGVGQRFRKRMFFNPMVNEDMCGISLMESENCIGIENECETLDDECAVTAWSDWSPCSVTCAKGIRERRRYYLRKMDMKVCDRETEGQEMCIADPMDCSKANDMKNFTAICVLEMDVGPCRGRFTRWFYDTATHKCMEFIYGGCRGNNNRFRSFDECHEMCVEHMRSIQDKKHQSHEIQQDKEVDFGQVNINCMISEWSDWSECSATCGKAYKFKRRIVKQEALGKGSKCPRKLEKKKRCETKKCPIDCELGPWVDWSPCGKSCGSDSIQERTRHILRMPRRNGTPCDARLERRYCSLPPCPEQSTRKLSKEEQTRRLKQLQESRNL